MPEPEPPGLAGLRALVTGGSSGIGLATARQLLQSGCRVAVLDVQPPPAEESEELRYVVADLRDDGSVRSAVADCARALDGLDILVNNAGVGARGRIEDNEDAEWNRLWDVNVLGMVRVTRAALPTLRRSSAAAIVTIGSIAATAGLPERVLYSATKGAVLAMSRAMAADLVGEGIRVNVVSPGTVHTPFVDRLLALAVEPEAERRAMEARQPHGRFVSADEVAAAIVYLAGPASASVTGIELAVDGGMAALRLPARSRPTTISTVKWAQP